MGKTDKGRDKARAKAAKAKAKIARKCKAAAKSAAAAACMSALFAGCLGTQTPSRSQSLTIRNCSINVYGCGTETNEVPRVELATQAMSIENSGTETQTVTPTQTTDVKPDVNVNYAQGGGITSRGTGGAAGTGGVAGTLEKLFASLTDEGAAALRSALADRLDGALTLQKKDGSSVTVECRGGQCSIDGK